MRSLLLVVILSGVALAQQICTSSTIIGSTSINCSDGSTATVQRLYSLPNFSAYQVTVTPPPSNSGLRSAPSAANSVASAENLHTTAAKYKSNDVCRYGC